MFANSQGAEAAYAPAEPFVSAWVGPGEAIDIAVPIVGCVGGMATSIAFGVNVFSP